MQRSVVMRLCALMFLAGTINLQHALAQNTITEIEVIASDKNDLCVSDNVTFKIKSTGSDPVQSVAWDCSCTDFTPNINTNWTLSGNNQISKTMDKVGNFTIKATATYKPYPVGAAYTVSKTVSVTINPPNKVEPKPGPWDVSYPLIVVPNGTTGTPPIATYWQIKRNNRSVGLMTTSVQEKVDRNPAVGESRPYGTTDYVYMSNVGEIFDGKGMNIQQQFLPSWDAYNPQPPIAPIVDDLVQQFRVELRKGNGQAQWYELTPSYRIKYWKEPTVGGTRYYKMTVAPN